MVLNTTPLDQFLSERSLVNMFVDLTSRAVIHLVIFLIFFFVRGVG